MEAIQEHPDYHDGFHDAAMTEPLFDGASEPYQAGWHAYWECRRLLDQAATEPTQAGLQYVIPGCEKDQSRGPVQMSLF